MGTTGTKGSTGAMGLGCVVICSGTAADETVTGDSALYIKSKSRVCERRYVNVYGKNKTSATYIKHVFMYLLVEAVYIHVCYSYHDWW